MGCVGLCLLTRMNSTFLAGHPVQGAAGSCLQRRGGVRHPAQPAGVHGWPTLGLGSSKSVAARLMHPANASRKLPCCCFCRELVMVRHPERPRRDGAYRAPTEHPSGQTLATDSFGIWSYSERPKEFLLPRYKNLHSFLWAKQAGFLLV